MKYSFSGKSVLVSGAASGIGAATARLLAANGLAVVLSDLQADAVERLAAEIAAAGGQALAHAGDVARAEDAEAAVACAIRRFGALHYAFNNAGIGGTLAPAGELGAADWQRVIDINLGGVAHALRCQIPAILAAGGGAIVNMSSNVARRGVANRAPYVCSKWALNGLTQTLALEVAEHNIRVNAVCPGPVMTERLDGAMKLMAHERGMTFETLRAEWEAESPMKRFATAEECANVVLFLASDTSSGMTGQALNVTAGMLMT